MAKRKRTKEQIMIYKTPHRKRTSNTNLTENQGWTERASSSRSTSGIRRSLVINSVINYKWRFDTKGKSEAVNRRRTDNTMAKRKSTRTNNDLQNTTQKTNDRATRTPLKTKVELRCSRMITFPALHLTHVVLQWPKEKGQTLIHKTLHRKRKIEQHHILIITFFKSSHTYHSLFTSRILKSRTIQG
jgi:hypothetical protein